jgi:hypothetical protein
MLTSSTDAAARAAADMLSLASGATRIAILYHADPDGLMAASFLTTYITRCIGVVPRTYAVTTDNFDFAKAIHWLDEQSAECVLTVDLNFGSRPGALATVLRSAPTVIVYDDHDAVEQPAETSTRLRLSAQERGRPVPATYFGYVLWQEMHDPSESAQWMAAAGLIADRAYDLMPSASRLFGDDRKRVDTLIRLISAYYSSLSFVPTEDGWLRALVIALGRSQHLAELLSAGADVVRDSRERRAVIDEVVDRQSAALANVQPLGLVGGLPLYLRRFRADVRVANLVASTARAKLDKAHGIVVACQDLPDGSTMTELRLTLSAPEMSLPLLLGQVSRNVQLLNFGGHPRASGCRYDSALHDGFVAALLAG